MIAIKLLARGRSDLFNSVSVPLFDRDNNWAEDELSVVEAVDVARQGQEIASRIEVLGVNSYPMAFRAAKVALAESLRGNPRADTGGTYVFQVESSLPVLHLRPRQIIGVTAAKFGLNRQLFRVLKVARDSKSDQVTLELMWHQDGIYLDSYAPFRGATPVNAAPVGRLPNPWQPNVEAPIPGDAIYSSSEKSFRLGVLYTTLTTSADVIPSLVVTAEMPIGRLSGVLPPIVEPQMEAGPGGSLAAGSYWAHVHSIDENGVAGPESPVSQCTIASGSNNRLTLNVTGVDDRARQLRVYLGADPRRRSRAVDVAPAPTGPATILLPGPVQVAGEAGPDHIAEKAVLAFRRIRHGGVFGAECSAVSPGTLTFAGYGFTPDAFVGHILTLYGTADGRDLPIANFRVTANTDEDFAVTPDPAEIAVVGDVFVMRMKPQTTGRTVTDVTWQNPASNSGAGLPIDSLSGLTLYLTAGVGAGRGYTIVSNTANSITVDRDFVDPPDDRSIAVILEARREWTMEHDVRDISRAGSILPMRIDVDNLGNQSLMVFGYTQSASAARSLPVLDPIREIYIAGAPPGRVFIAADYEQRPGDRFIFIDATAGNIQVRLLPSDLWRGQILTLKRTDASANTVEIVPAGVGADTEIDGNSVISLDERNAWFQITPNA